MLKLRPFFHKDALRAGYSEKQIEELEELIFERLRMGFVVASDEIALRSLKSEQGPMASREASLEPNDMFSRRLRIEGELAEFGARIDELFEIRATPDDSLHTKNTLVGGLDAGMTPDQVDELRILSRLFVYLDDTNIVQKMGCGSETYLRRWIGVAPLFLRYNHGLMSRNSDLPNSIAYLSKRRLEGLRYSVALSNIVSRYLEEDHIMTAYCLAGNPSSLKVRNL